NGAEERRLISAALTTLLAPAASTTGAAVMQGRLATPKRLPRSPLAQVCTGARPADRDTRHRRRPRRRDHPAPRNWRAPAARGDGRGSSGGCAGHAAPASLDTHSGSPARRLPSTYISHSLVRPYVR